MTQRTAAKRHQPNTSRPGVIRRLHWAKRWMYRGGRPHGLAKALNRVWAAAFAAGRLSPDNAMTLEVPGRRTGKTIAFPVVVAEHDGGRYLVSMLGKDANWVRNVRAADGHAVLRRNGAQHIRLVEVAPADRAPILRAYLNAAPGARPHFPVDRHASLEEFSAISQEYPAFRVVPDQTTPATTVGLLRASLELSTHLTVRPGELDGFTRQAAECIRLTRELDTGTLRYDWFLRSDGIACEVREAYTGAAALAEHRTHIGPALQLLLDMYADDHETTVYGEASQQLRDLAEAQHMTDHLTWFTFLGGLDPAPRH